MHQIVHKSEKLPPPPTHYIDLGLELILFKNGAKRKSKSYICVYHFLREIPRKNQSESQLHQFLFPVMGKFFCYTPFFISNPFLTLARKIV